MSKFPTRPCYGGRRHTHLRFHVVLKLLFTTVLPPSYLVVHAGAGAGRETCLLAELAKPRLVRAVETSVPGLRHISTFRHGRSMRLRRGALGLANRNETATTPKTRTLDGLMHGDGSWWRGWEVPLKVLLIGRVNGTEADVVEGGMQTVTRDEPVIAARPPDAHRLDALLENGYARFVIRENSSATTLLYVPRSVRLPDAVLEMLATDERAAAWMRRPTP